MGPLEQVMGRPVVLRLMHPVFCYSVARRPVVDSSCYKGVTSLFQIMNSGRSCDVRYQPYLVTKGVDGTVKGICQGVRQPKGRGVIGEECMSA
jgi:hypothetical protein